MKLSQLFPGKVHADADIGGITLDSRHVRDGDLFVAFPGLRHDGRDYIAQAVAAGAAAVVLESQGAVAHQLAVPSVPTWASTLAAEPSVSGCPLNSVPRA